MPDYSRSEEAAGREPLLVPVENQVRELESKLFFACVAAARGRRVILGSRSDMHRGIARLPRGTYVAKSMASSSVRMFGILQQLGHEIVAWVDDALVHYPPEPYFEKRIDPAALRRVGALFAWGEDDAELFRKCPAYHGAPIHVTGNPRMDLLRPELRGYFDAEAARIRERWGEFVLINTNFGKLNHYLPELSSMQPPSEDADEAGDFHAGFARHRQTVFEHFRRLVPALAEAFPGRPIVVRPHPVENPAPWRTAAGNHANVHVVLEGNVIPWLMASRALIHNGCTTAVEAFLIRVPSLSFEPVCSPRFDFELPARLSHRAGDFDALCAALDAVLGGRVGPCDEPEQWRCLEHHLAALEGPLAADRIVDVLEARPPAPPPPLGARVGGWLRANRRAARRWLRARRSGTGARERYERHRFPGLSEVELRDRIARLDRGLGRFADLAPRRLSRNVFEIARRAG